MPYTNNELQKRFKKKMYKSNLKQLMLWVKRKKSRQKVKMTQKEFIKTLEKLTTGWDDESLSELYIMFIEIIKGKKEVAKLKRK